MCDEKPVRPAAAGVVAALDLLPGAAGIPRLLDEVIWQVRHARAATQIIAAEQQPADNWLAVAAKWDQVALLAAELRDRTESQARP